MIIGKLLQSFGHILAQIPRINPGVMQWKRLQRISYQQLVKKKMKKNKILALKKEIKDGIESGIAQVFVPIKHLEFIKSGKNVRRTKP
ncbi:MAG: hypothetical protein GX102_02260 [Porphyromonadaceae bacterium]|nr:hypothetical protein [Porphyromonadaceae bacterium]